MNYSGLDRVFRDARCHQGYSVEEAAEGSTLTVAQVETMESGGFDELSREPFRAGLVCLYGDFLGVDVKAIYAESDKPEVAAKEIVNISRLRRFAAGMIVLLVVSIGWMFVMGPIGPEDAERSVVDDKQRVSFMVTQRGYFVVTVDGETVVDGPLEAGAPQEFSGDDLISVRLPSIDAIRSLSYNGKSVSPDGIPRHRRWLSFGNMPKGGSRVR